jgi:hypothetical protein
MASNLLQSLLHLLECHQYVAYLLLSPRLLLLHLQASDVAVLQREDQQLGMPRFVAVVKGLDFGQQFATQFGGLLTGALQHMRQWQHMKRSLVVVTEVVLA